MLIRNEIAERLRQARAESRLTLRDVAAEIEDMSHVTIMNYEHGNTSPTVEALILLARVYERDVTWFLPKEVAGDA